MPVQRLPADPGELAKLARRAGFEDGDELRERVERWRDEIRRAYDLIIR